MKKETTSTQNLGYASAQFWQQIPAQNLRSLAEYWSNKKLAFNKKEITLYKGEFDELKQVQMAIDKHWPYFNHLFDLNNSKYKNFVRETSTIDLILKAATIYAKQVLVTFKTFTKDDFSPILLNYQFIKDLIGTQKRETFNIINEASDIIRLVNNPKDVESIEYIIPDFVPTKKLCCFLSTSHRSSEKISQVGIKNISLWSLTYNKTAATSLHLCFLEDFNEISHIKGIKKLTGLPKKHNFFSRHECKELDQYFDFLTEKTYDNN
jgi:hypothetical protein